MAKALLLGIILAFGSAGFALAQTDQAAPADTTAQGGPGVRAGNITSTGETVPNPGVSQSAGTTPLDRGIQREDDKIQSGICKGC